MEPLTTWERKGLIEWNPALGVFHDTWVSDDISGPMYLVTVRLDLPDEPVWIMREQRALVPSLAERRVRGHFERYFPAERIHVVLVRRGRLQWSGWRMLARSGGYPSTRLSRPATNDR